MKVHTTNYFNTFIEVAEDTKVNSGTMPPAKGDKPTVARLQFELLNANPYKYTSDELLFQVYAERNDITATDYEQEREMYFSKGQPCLRASPLTKTYSFGAHCDDNGKVAIYGMETDEYSRFIEDEQVKKIKAMRSAR